MFAATGFIMLQGKSVFTGYWAVMPYLYSHQYWLHSQCLCILQHSYTCRNWRHQHRLLHVHTGLVYIHLKCEKHGLFYICYSVMTGVFGWDILWNKRILNTNCQKINKITNIYNISSRLFIWLSATLCWRPDAWSSKFQAISL